MKKQVIASINEICEELDALGLYNEANRLTNVMMKVADKPEIFEKAVVRKLDGKIIVEFTNNFWNYRRSQRDFETIEQARKYARTRAHKVEVYD
jgi:hypothetical protein